MRHAGRVLEIVGLPSLPLASGAVAVAMQSSGEAIGAGQVIALAVAVVSALAGAVVALFWATQRAHDKHVASIESAHGQVIAAKEAQITSLKETSESQLSQALNNMLTVVAAKDQTIISKDQTIKEALTRNEVLDGRVVDTGRLHQETATATKDAIGGMTRALEEITEQVRQGRKEEAETHKQQTQLLQLMLPERPPKAKPAPRRRGTDHEHSGT